VCRLRPPQHRLRLKCDGTRLETRFRLSTKRTSPFKSAGASAQSTTGSRDVRISGSNAGYTKFRGSVKFTLHFPSRASPSAITFQTQSTSGRVCIVAKKPYELHFRPAVRIYQAQLALDGFPEIWYCGFSWKPVEKVQIWLKLDKNVGRCTSRPEYVLLLPATLNRHKSSLLDWSGWCEAVRIAEEVQILRELAKILRYLYITYLVFDCMR